VALKDGIHVIDAGRSGLRDRLEYSTEGALPIAPEEKAP